MAQGDMPYSIEKEGDVWCVYDKKSGKKLAERNSRMAAMSEMRRLMKGGKPEEETKAEDAGEDGEE